MRKKFISTSFLYVLKEKNEMIKKIIKKVILVIQLDDR
jgi:hypothetical protein